MERSEVIDVLKAAFDALEKADGLLDSDELDEWMEDNRRDEFGREVFRLRDQVLQVTANFDVLLDTFATE
jgi:hypothetical protein